MPDLSGWPILDVAIGLSFLFFLLSVAASAFYELIAAVARLRARNLESAIRSLLGDDLGYELYDNWRIRALFQKPDQQTSRGPSYIPPRAFALALFDTLARDVVSPADRPSNEVIEAAATRVGRIANPRVQAQLTAILATASADVAKGLLAAEQLFNNRMERASGWYKRRAQYVLWGIAVVMAFAANINAFNVGSDLWKNDALRAAVVTQARAALEKPAANRDAAGGCPAGQVPDTSTKQTSDCTPDPQALKAVAESVDDIRQLDLPIGWSDRNSPTGDPGGIFGFLGGCLITAAAISLGAPFWFSTLQRFADLRGAGARPDDATAAAKDNKSGAEKDTQPDKQEQTGGSS